MKSMAPRAWARASLSLLAVLPIASLFAPWNLEPVPSFHQEWLAIMAGLLACVAALPLLWRAGRVQIPYTVSLPLALTAYLAVQAKLLPQVVTQHAQMAMLYLLWAAVLMVLVSALVRQLGRHRVSLWLAAGLALAAACAGLREFGCRLQGMSGTWGGVTQANNYGDLLALGGISVLYLRDAAKLSGPILWRLLASSIVLGLSLSPSRSVWLYWVALLLLSWRYQRAWLKALLMGFAGYVLLQGLWSQGLLPAQQTAVERLVQQVNGAPVRWHIWQVAWQLFTQSPWLGHGFGQFDWSYFQAGRHIPELASRMEHAHNLILHLLAELGLLPVLLLLVVMAGWLRQLIMPDAGPARKPLHVWLLMLVSVLGIHSLLEYPLWYAQFLGIAALVLALGDGRRWLIRLSRGGLTGAGTLLVLGVAVAGMYEWQYARMELALVGAIADPSQRRFDHLVDVCKQVPEKAPLLLPYVPVIFTFASNATDEQMRPELTSLADASFRFWPTKKLAYRQALMQGLNGREPEAGETLRLAMTAYPDWAAQFVAELGRLSSADQQKVAFLRNMAEPVTRAQFESK
jgi:O-antigen ligase